MNSQQQQDIKNLKETFPTLGDTDLVLLWKDLRCEQFKRDLIEKKANTEFKIIYSGTPGYKFDVSEFLNCPVKTEMITTKQK
jgi:hypothetical protein